MKEELITYDTAKLAKEKGFDYPYIFPEQVGVLSCYSEIGDLGTSLMNNAIYNIQAPTQSLLQRWLREEHNLEVSACSNASGFLWMIDKSYHDGNISGGTFIKDSNDSGPNFSGEWETYEEALEQGLIEALKLIEI
jgi:hypothetical protein